MGDEAIITACLFFWRWVLNVYASINTRTRRTPKAGSRLLGCEQKGVNTEQGNTVKWSILTAVTATIDVPELVGLLSPTPYTIQSERERDTHTHTHRVADWTRPGLTNNEGIKYMYRAVLHSKFHPVC